MKPEWFSEHWNDADDNPAGGVSSGCGFTISWQNGPLGTGDDRKAPNGAFVECVIEAVRDRIEYYQGSKFACEDNALALDALTLALTHLRARTIKREREGVEGTHAVHSG